MLLSYFNIDSLSHSWEVCDSEITGDIDSWCCFSASPSFGRSQVYKRFKSLTLRMTGSTHLPYREPLSLSRWFVYYLVCAKPSHLFSSTQPRGPVRKMDKFVFPRLKMLNEPMTSALQTIYLNRLSTELSTVVVYGGIPFRFSSELTTMSSLRYAFELYIVQHSSA